MAVCILLIIGLCVSALREIEIHKYLKLGMGLAHGFEQSKNFYQSRFIKKELYKEKANRLKPAALQATLTKAAVKSLTTSTLLNPKPFNCHFQPSA